MPKYGKARKPRWTVYYTISGRYRNGKEVVDTDEKHMIVEANTKEEAIKRVTDNHHREIVVHISYAVQEQEDRRGGR